MRAPARRDKLDIPPEEAVHRTMEEDAMAAGSGRRTVAGSERAPLAAARSAGLVPREERFEVTVRVRARTPAHALVEGGADGERIPAARQYVTREEYAARHGADPEDIERVEAFARAHGLVVVEASAARCSVFLSGTAAQFEAAFGTRIEHYESKGRTYRGRTGALTVPEAIADVVQGVFGIDDRPAAVAHFQWREEAAGATARIAPPTRARSAPRRAA